MNITLGTFREVTVFIADNLFQAATGLPFDLRQGNLLLFVIFAQTEAIAATRYEFSKVNGHMLPKSGIEYSQYDRGVMDEYNRILDAARLSEQKELDRAMRDLFPIAIVAGEGYGPFISVECNRFWQEASTTRQRDPLAIDLDSDGIETIGIPATGNPILFDHDADGIKTGTGWLKGDDAWLAFDRDGNGSIDSGRELFGVDTLITVTELDASGQMQSVTRNARSGFEALQTLDTGSGSVGSAGYADRVFDAKDAQFAAVRVWRDLNGDGTSQAGELQTLAQAGIGSISLNPAAAGTDLGNGNSVTATATVMLSNGSATGVAGVNLSAENLDLANNPFYREYTDQTPLTSGVSRNPVA